MIPSDIESYYKLHSKFYDLTRWGFLFGRNAISSCLPELEAGSKMLDLGCGTGKHLNELVKKYPGSQIIGFDQSEEMLGHVNPLSKDLVQLMHSKYAEHSFEENSFDLILCSYSLSMFDDTEQTLSHIRMHLKKTGKLLIVDFDSTPFSWFSKWMKINHVSFEANLFSLLEREFNVEFKQTRKAYLGLYSYSIFMGKKH